jgi:lipoprotein-anchoring transpeptidase ErfK/SrfK
MMKSILPCVRAAVAAASILIAFTDYSQAVEVVAFSSKLPEGTILVQTRERTLYLALTDGRALRYSVGVGRVDRQWAGRTSISGKYLAPNWAPPVAISLAQPKVAQFIAGGSAANPMGAAAMTLSGGEYAIHGTNTPASIGHFVSYGCIRMQNRDIMDLYQRVHIGTEVIVIR